jgi:hypothetical protein
MVVVPTPIPSQSISEPIDFPEDDEDDWLESVLAMEEDMTSQTQPNNSSSGNTMEIDAELPSSQGEDKCRTTVRQFLREKGIDGFGDLEKKVELNACIAYNIDRGITPLIDRTNNAAYNCYIYDAVTPEQVQQLLMDATIRTMFVKAEEARKLGWNTLFNPPSGRKDIEEPGADDNKEETIDPR